MYRPHGLSKATRCGTVTRDPSSRPHCHIPDPLTALNRSLLAGRPVISTDSYSILFPASASTYRAASYNANVHVDKLPL